MITEYKITSPEDIGSVDCKRNIVLGDEGCIFKAMDKNIIDCMKKAYTNDMDIRYVTPIVPDKLTNELKNFILILAKNKPLKVTFNDYGMLYVCRDLINNSIIIPVLGRILTRSIIDSPWYDKILADEDGIVQDALIGSTIVHSSKIDILKRLKISEIEINKYSSIFVKELKTCGLGITVRLDGFLISTGRVCYSTYWNKLDLQQCNEHSACKNKIKITLMKKWSKSKKMLSLPRIEDKAYYSNIYVKGNQVFSEIASNLFDNYQYVDSLIVDYKKSEED